MEAPKSPPPPMGSSREQKKASLKPPDVKIVDLASVAKVWKQLLKTGQYADVTFIIGPEKKEYRCHRLVFLSWSDVFRDTFAVQGDRIELPSVMKMTFRVARNYMYTGTLKFHPIIEDAFPLVAFSQRFHIKSLEILMLKWLEEQVSDSTAFAMLARPELKNIESLNARVLDLVENRFEQLDIRHPSFAALPQEVLQRLLKSTKISASEEKLFDAVLVWVKQRPKEAQDRCLIALMPLIRCSSLNLDFFYERLKNERLIHPHSAFLKQLYQNPRNPRRGAQQPAIEDEGSERSERSEHSENKSDLSKDDWDDYKAQKWSVL